VKGNYQLLATYGNNEIGHASFLITSVDTPNIPVFVNIGSLEIDDEEITLSGNEKSTVEVYGNIKNYEKGNPISLKVIHPDGMITDVSVTGKRIGDFKAHVSIGDAWKSGTFSIIASYDGKDFGQVNFVLNKIQIPELIQKSDSAKPQIPDWIKNNAKWWVDDTIDDKAFVGGIQFLIKEGLIQIPETVTSTIVASQEIPSWIKNNADWWSQGLIPDADFLKGIQFLVENGIIVV